VEIDRDETPNPHLAIEESNAIRAREEPLFDRLRLGPEC
jgi:hypothetical protein